MTVPLPWESLDRAGDQHGTEIRSARRLPDGLLRAHAPALSTWLVGVVLGFGVQIGEGLGRPSEGLALSAACLPAVVVALAPRRLRRWMAAGITVLLGAMAVVNVLHHRVFDTYVSVRSLGLLDQGWAVRDYAISLLGVGDVLIPVAVLLGLVVLLGAEAGPTSRGERGGGRLPVTLLVLGCLPSLWWAWYVAPSDADHDTGGFLHAHVVDLRGIVGEWRRGGPATAEERHLVERWFEEHPTPPPSADPWFGTAEGASVLMIQVEALNAWLLEAEVDGQPVVPVLRELAARGLHFTRVFDQTHHGRSSDADHLVMVSQHALERAALAMVRPTLDPLALPDILRERGYATLSAHAHHRGFWNSGLRHPRYGFQESLFDLELGPGESLGFGLVDRVFFQRAAPHIAALPQPYLAWLITLTMHAPYPPPPASFRTHPLGSLEGTPLGGYFLRAHHTDAALGELLASLEAAGVLENTMVVVYGDHTEHALFDPRRLEEVAGTPWGTPGPAPEARRLLQDRVPVIVLPPGEDPATSVRTVGGLLDLAPTVLHLLGVPVPRGFLGRPLTAEREGFAAHASGEVVASDRMWTGEGCYAVPTGAPLRGDACDAIRHRARQELEVSWILSRGGRGLDLSPAGEGRSPPP